MKRPTYKGRFSLTLIFAAVIFCVLLLSVGISLLTTYILTVLGAMSTSGEDPGMTSQILIMGLISVVIGAIFSVLTGRISLRPVSSMISQMRRLASGDFDARLDFGSPLQHHPAFNELSDSFNTMAEELGSTEMLRSDFINNFSHEFKTPIVSISGFAKLLKSGNLTEEQKTEYIGIIEEESRRLAYMAENVLNLTKIENQTILSDETEYNLSEQIRASILLLESKWSKKNIELQIDFGEYVVYANEELLKQVWINLVDNAVKFTPDGGTVEISIGEEAGRVVVDVINYGVEIPPEQRDKIFNKFYQGDMSHASDGNGIGLAIVKSVVALHRGAVAVVSGGGMTKFTVTLPQKRKKK